MRVFVGEAHLSALVANYLTILCCSLANFWAENNWAFAEAEGAPPGFVVRANKTGSLHV